MSTIMDVCCVLCLIHSIVRSILSAPPRIPHKQSVRSLIRSVPGRFAADLS